MELAKHGTQHLEKLARVTKNKNEKMEEGSILYSVFPSTVWEKEKQWENYTGVDSELNKESNLG